MESQEEEPPEKCIPWSGPEMRGEVRLDPCSQGGVIMLGGEGGTLCSSRWGGRRAVDIVSSSRACPPDKPGSGVPGRAWAPALGVRGTEHVLLGALSCGGF